MIFYANYLLFRILSVKEKLAAFNICPALSHEHLALLFLYILLLFYYSFFIFHALLSHLPLH